MRDRTFPEQAMLNTALRQLGNSSGFSWHNVRWSIFGVMDVCNAHPGLQDLYAELTEIQTAAYGLHMEDI